MFPSINAFWKRRLIFLYDMTLLGILVALAVLYFKTNAIGHFLPEELRGLPAYTAWFGVLGSIAISFKGLSDWGPDEALWGGRWPLWYVGRPFSGLIVGIMTFVLLRAIYPSGTPSVPTFEAAAFILGTQEARFFNFLAKVGELVLSVPENRPGNPDPPAG
jgi:hypothetical protein